VYAHLKQSSTPLTTQPGTRLVSYAVVAGGGGGGSANNSAGGGGAGGLRTCLSFIVCGATAYPITVGAGGAAGTATPGCNSTAATSGNPSIFSNITSTGGEEGLEEQVVVQLMLQQADRVVEDLQVVFILVNGQVEQVTHHQ
jgi:hypothetical protein